MTTGTLVSIHIHPIKSCRRIELDEVTVAAYGLATDRQWQVVDAGRNGLTQRQHRHLAIVQPELTAGGLRISAPGHGSIEVAQPMADDATAITLLGDEVPVGDGGDEAAAWFSTLLGEPCRLVSLTSPDARRVRLIKQQPVTFVDAAPVLVTNTASLDDLRARATEPFGMERFRPNLVVETDEPWAEDTWQRFAIGGATLDAVLPWPRCAVPQIDQDTAERWKEPAVALKAHRWCTSVPQLSPGLRGVLEGKALFGMACAIGPEGTTLRIGDALRVETTTEALLAPPR